jgi:tyrosine-protein kinase Etk/Wzc
VPAPTPALPDVRTPKDQDIDLKEFLRLGIKHLRLIGAITGCGVLLAAVYVLVAPPTYEASVTIKVPDTRGGSGVLKDLAMLSSSSDPMETYLEVAQSTNVAARAAGKAGLRQQPEYAGAYDGDEVVVDAQKKVSVSLVKLSNLLVIKAQARDPRLAASLADAWAEGFIEANLDFSRTGAHNKRQFIEQQLAGVKERLLQGEEVLRHLAERQKSMGSISRDNDQRSSDRDPIVLLKTQVMGLEVDRATLASRYSQDHPAMREIDAKLKEAQAQLDKEMAALPKNEMDYLRLERDVKVDEAIYNMLLESGEEARIEENVDDSGIVVVDKAQVPRIKVAPRETRVLFLSLVLSLALALAVMLVVARIQDQIGSEEDLKRLTGLPVLGLIPDWRAEGPGPEPGQARHDPSYLINAERFDHTYYSESFKSLRTNLGFTGMGAGLKTLSVMSPGRAEGKTLANCNLALALALAGNKVCLVDADLRKPSVHKAFGLAVSARKGLPLLLSGQASAAGMLQRGPVAGLQLLPCGVHAPNPAELLGSPRVAGLIAWLKARFDYVIFDAAPLLPVTDSVAFSARLDGVVLLARFEQTRRGDLLRGMEQLAGVKARVLGMLLNAVDMRKYSYTYGYGRRYDAYGADGALGGERS